MEKNTIEHRSLEKNTIEHRSRGKKLTFSGFIGMLPFYAAAAYSAGVLFAGISLNDKIREIYSLKMEKLQSLEESRKNKGDFSRYFLRDADSVQSAITEKESKIDSLKDKVWKSWYYFVE